MNKQITIKSSKYLQNQLSCSDLGTKMKLFLVNNSRESDYFLAEGKFFF
jgi:hypothetical protein